MSARRIRQPVESKDDIAKAFDGITYEKGAAAIAMFEQWLGEEAFRSGIRDYLQQHSDRNADAEDFLAAIGKAPGRNVTAPFGTFLD